MSGKTYDLQSLFDRLNRLYFDGKLELQVRWSIRKPVKASSRVLLGYYTSQKKMITMSRRLDNPRVPLYFVEHVLFHEMLHSVFPNEKHRMHTEKFRKYERMHPDYERAREWEKQSLSILFHNAQSSFGFFNRIKLGQS
jgi:predicted metal-dependent hydrolase